MSPAKHQHLARWRVERWAPFWGVHGPDGSYCELLTHAEAVAYATEQATADLAARCGQLAEVPD